MTSRRALDTSLTQPPSNRHNDGVEHGTQRAWVVRAGKAGVHADAFEQQGIVGVDFSPMADLTGMGRQAIIARAREVFPTKHLAGNVAGQLDRFVNEVAVGDLIVTPNGETRELLYGRVTGAYDDRSTPAIGDYRHVRTVEWLGRRDRDPLPDRMLFSLGSLLTVYAPGYQEELRAFLDHGTVPSGGDEPDAPSEPDGVTEDPTGAAEQEARNRELIRKRIADLGPYPTQDFVAGVLRALGYHTEVSPPGADGGIDIRASRDALFIQPPIVKVQVKARPESKAPPADVRALKGVLERDERGVFVSTGGFTGPAITEFEKSSIQLIGMDRLISLFLEHYERLDAETRALVPLRRIWVLEDDGTAEGDLSG